MGRERERERERESNIVDMIMVRELRGQEGQWAKTVLRGHSYLRIRSTKNKMQVNQPFE
jgi:hypothetical protein